MVAIALMGAQPALAQAAAAPPGAAPAGAASCTGCHALSGAPTPMVSLRGRDAADIAETMRAFRSGERESTVMGRIAKGFSDDEIQAISAWLAAQP